jgi:XisH protein
MTLEISDEPDRILYLAVPRDAYWLFLRFEPTKIVIEPYRVRLIVYQKLGV